MQCFSKTSNLNEILKECLFIFIIKYFVWLSEFCHIYNHFKNRDFSSQLTYFPCPSRGLFRCTWCYWETGPWFGHAVWASEWSITAVWLLASIAWHRPEKLHFFLSVSSMQETACQLFNPAKTSLDHSPHIMGGDGPGLLGGHFFSRLKPDSPSLCTSLHCWGLIKWLQQRNIGSENMQATTAATFSA